MRGPTDVVPHSRVSQQQRLEYEPIHHHSTQWLIHALNHIITQFGSTINVLINLKGPKVYVILVILIGASYIYQTVSALNLITIRFDDTISLDLNAVIRSQC